MVTGGWRLAAGYWQKCFAKWFLICQKPEARSQQPLLKSTSA
jgi:hypothetical protein